MRGFKSLFTLGMWWMTMGCGASEEVAVEAVTEVEVVNVAAAEEASGHGHDHAHGDGHAHEAEAHTCTCAGGHAGGTVWCGHCAMGYVNGESTTDKAAVDAALAAK